MDNVVPLPQAPRQLSTVPASPFYDRKACDRIDRVFVDGRHVPHCVAYDMDDGWAFGKDNHGIWQAKQRGNVTVKLK
jgi:hypothetical protein